MVREHLAVENLLWLSAEVEGRKYLKSEIFEAWETFDTPSQALKIEEAMSQGIQESSNGWENPWLTVHNETETSDLQKHTTEFYQQTEGV